MQCFLGEALQELRYFFHLVWLQECPRGRWLCTVRGAAAPGPALTGDKTEGAEGSFGDFSLASHLFLFTSSTSVLIRVITLDQLSVMACCLSNGFSFVISLLGTMRAGRGQEKKLQERLLHPAWDCQNFQIIKKANLLPFPLNLIFILLFCFIS